MSDLKVRRPKSGLFQPSLTQHEAAVAEVCEAFVVRGEEHAGARLAAEGEEERADLRARARVEVARRLVGEDEAGPRDEGAGDGHALLLAARKLSGRVSEARPESDLIQQLARAG